MFCTEVKEPRPAPRAERSRMSTRRYQSTCIAESGRKMVVSVLGGNPFSTSALRRRSRQRCSSQCSWPTRPGSTVPSFASTEVSKSSDDVKMSGNRKLSSAHSSCRLFWIGVPVSSRRRCEGSWRRITARREFSFLRRCASSTTRQPHWTFLSAAVSELTVSYVVRHTSYSRSRSR